MTTPWAKRRHLLTATEWWPWTVPIACNYFVVHNLGPNNLLLRTDKDDAATEDTIEPATQDGIVAAPNVTFPGGDKRCAAGTVVAYLKLADGSPDQTVVCTYVD